jgi:hypothetical protein
MDNQQRPQPPQYVTTDYLAKGLASIKTGATEKRLRAEVAGDRFQAAHAQGMLDAGQAVARGIESYFQSGIGVAESPYVQIVAVAAVVEGICLGLIGFALWLRELEPGYVELDVTPKRWGMFPIEGYANVYRELLEDQANGRISQINVGVHHVRVVVFAGELETRMPDSWIEDTRTRLRGVATLAADQSERSKLLGARDNVLNQLERIARYAREDLASLPPRLRLAVEHLAKLEAELLKAGTEAA